jgi:hypothetical protein
LRNAVFHAGGVFEVGSISEGAFLVSRLLTAVCVSRNVASLGKNCWQYCQSLQIVAFEWDSHLSAIAPSAFERCDYLRSIAIPSGVGRFGRCCFYGCESLQLVMFDQPCLAQIDGLALFACKSLTRFVIPASVREIDASAFAGGGIRSVVTEEGSLSFRVRNGFLVDFEGRSLVRAMGCPESILIPSWIEELGPSCCAWSEGLRTVAFESDLNPRSIGQFAFRGCGSLESVHIPSSVEVLGTACFWYCLSLRTVTFSPESKLRLIEGSAFSDCRSLESIRIPSSVEVLGADCFWHCPSVRTVTFSPESKLRLIEARAFSDCASLELVSIPASVEVVGQQPVSSDHWA